jgi:hypothetical protein
MDVTCSRGLPRRWRFLPYGLLKSIELAVNLAAFRKALEVAQRDSAQPLFGMDQSTLDLREE